MHYNGAMRPEDHSFDWKGFIFFGKLLAVLAVAAGAGYSGLTYAQTYFAEQTVAAAVSTDTPPQTPAFPLAPDTPQRVISSLTIADVVPAQGKFIAANLVEMKLYLYQDGAVVKEYPIQTKGKPGTPWETPSGLYSIKTKEEKHFSSIGKVYMPYSMQFYGNYFIHGWTYYPDGTPTAASFSGGCIKLRTDDAQAVFEFAELGVPVFVYDNKHETLPPKLLLGKVPKPPVEAASYLIADIDTGDIYAERDSKIQRPIASVTKLMTALVANETISLDKKVSVPEGVLYNPPRATSTDPRTFLVNDLFYPLLMQSSNGVAESLADYYGTKAFVGWMNATARSLDMHMTAFADASGISAGNVSTAEDLFRLLAYLANKKSFVLKITESPGKSITAEDGSVYKVINVNTPSFEPPFTGGKAGQTTAAQETFASVATVSTAEGPRRTAIIVLGSPDQIADARALAQWVEAAVTYSNYQEADCVACTAPQRHIDL